MAKIDVIGPRTNGRTGSSAQNSLLFNCSHCLFGVLCFNDSACSKGKKDYKFPGISAAPDNAVVA